MNIIEIQAPKLRTNNLNSITVFLGGSIEMGQAKPWQKHVIDSIKSYDLHEDDVLRMYDVVFYNPRRDDWDSSWQNSKYDKKFNEQVTWEILQQENADINVYFFAENTISPITLLEFGYFANKPNVIVAADEQYCRKGNVEIMCDHLQLPLHNLDFLPREIIRKLQHCVNYTYKENIK